MKVFVAGATGVVGTRLVPELRRRGHDVVGTTRTPERRDPLRALGAEPILMDALDPMSVKDAVATTEPDVIVHELTALSASPDPKRFDEEFAQTDRLRTEGTANLLAAAHATGVGRVVAQSYAGWPSGRRGGLVKTETDPLDHEPAPPMRPALEAIRELESAVTSDPEVAGVVLRYGAFYGPGTAIGEGGAIVDALHHRRFPLVGSGAGVWSFVHVDDAVSATVAAIESNIQGIVNVVDDEPAPVSSWLPFLAKVVGAPSPRRVPRWLARPLIGRAGTILMTEVRGASNAKSKRELEWKQRFPTWRTGFVQGLA